MVRPLIATLLLAHAGLSLPSPGTRYELRTGESRLEFLLPATGHTVRGLPGQWSGFFRARPAGDTLLLEGEVRIAAASLDTGNRRRDRKMHRKSLAVDEYPEILFRPTRCKLHTPSGQPELEGELTIRGITRAITMPVQFEADAEAVRVRGEVVLRWADFGIPDPSFLFLRVRPTVTVRFDTRWSRTRPGP